jgi:hypothetical protein
MSLRRLTLAILLAAPLCGCGGYYQSGTPFIGQGNSVLQNDVVMIIDPQPSGAANTNIDMDGQRALVAIERYHTNTVVQPTELRTTEDLPVVGSDEGSGSSGNAETMK